MQSKKKINPESFRRFKIIDYLCTTFQKETTKGKMLEWLKRHAWKACKRLKRFTGSNPVLSAECEGEAKKVSPFLFSQLPYQLPSDPFTSRQDSVRPATGQRKKQRFSLPFLLFPLPLHKKQAMA